MFKCGLYVLLCVVFANGAFGAITIPSTNAGSDGVFSPSSDITIDLTNATTGTWSDMAFGSGIYDPAQWAVFFKFSSVNIPTSVDVYFTNHSSGAPVIWLVDGDVTISGRIHLTGEIGHISGETPQYAAPGPGGFRGGHAQGATQVVTSGFGYGGGRVNAGGAPGSGSYGGLGTGPSPGRTYGNPGIFPLIGGSGGAGSTEEVRGGGAGGGAILIATTGTIDLTSSSAIYANGGNGGGGGGAGGSGGAIRLVAGTVKGSGILQALGGNNNVSDGGIGRIAIEAEAETYSGLSNPAHNFILAVDPVEIIRDTTTPSARILSIGGVSIGSDPGASLNNAATDGEIGSGGTKEVIVECENVPSSATVSLSIVRVSVGTDEVITASFVGEVGTTSTWTAQVIIDEGFSSLVARATNL